MRALTPATAKLFSKIHVGRTDELHLSLSRDGDCFVADIYARNPLSPDRKTMPMTSSSFLERFPERKRLDQLGLVTYEIPATDIAALLIDELWPKSQLFMDDDARAVFDYLLLTCEQQQINATNFATYKATGAVPKHSLRMHPEFPLVPYQQVATVNSLRSEGYALFADMGTGKTPMTIARICNEAPMIKAVKRRPYRAIVVAPKNVRLNWQSEIEKFSTCKLRVAVLRGDQFERIKLLLEAFADKDADGVVIVCSYETMVNMWDDWLKNLEWDLAVLDEGHYVKWPETKRSQHAMKLRDQSAKRMLLTGTPIANSVLDVYSQLEFLGKGFSGFMKWKNFRTFYGVYKPTQGGHEALVGFQNLPFIQERLARVSFIITKREALPDLPEKVYDVIEVEMTQEQEDVYKQVAQDLAGEIESDLDNSDNISVTVNNVLTKLLRLAQITSGFVKIDDVYADDGTVIREGMIRKFTPNPKIDQLLETLKEKDENSKTIVWAHYRHDIIAISEALNVAGIKHVKFYGGTSEADRTEAERAFNHDRDCRVFVGSAGAGGVGLNLLGYPPGAPDSYETNCDHVIYFSQDWSSLKRGQSEDRANRRGTRVQTRISDLCVPMTIDEEIRRRVTGKRITAATIADIRDILKNVLRGFVE